jgi:hypothetical protein
MRNLRFYSLAPLFDLPFFVLLVILFVLLVSTGSAHAQAALHATPVASPTASTVVPQWVRYAGVASQADGKPRTGRASITFQVFQDEQGGESLWSETQSVTLDAAGHFQVHLGATSPAGLPAALFATGEARWLEVQVRGSTPQTRVLLASVPYAMKAADAATLGGLPASAFARAGSTDAQTLAAEPAGVHQDTATAVTTTGGATGYLPVYSGTSTIDNSLLFQSAANVGIGTTTPAATLDVHGSLDVRGTLTLENSGTATTTAGANSQPLDFSASTYNSSSKAAQNAVFALRAEPVGNDTTSPGATLNLLYGLGGTPGETGLKISTKGVFSFAPGQTFASTATSGNAVSGTSTSGIGVSGASTSGDGVLGDTAGTTVGTAGVLGVAGSGNSDGFGGIAGVWGNASAHVGVLGTSNQYAGAQGISGTGQGVRGVSTSNSGVQGTSTSGTGVAGSSSTADGVLGYTAGNTLGTAGVFGVAGPRTSFNGIAAVWGDASSHVGVFGSSTLYAGVYGASTNGNGIQGSSTSGTAGSFTSSGSAPTVTATNSLGTITLYASTTSATDATVYASASGTAGVGVSATGDVGGVYGSTGAGGTGLEGYSNTGVGVVGISVKPSVVGIGFRNEKTAIWADSGSNPFQTDIIATLMAFADDNHSALMKNNSNNYPTMYLQNNGSAGLGDLPAAAVLRAGGKSGSCGISVEGHLSCTGQVKTLSTTRGGRMVESYAVHSPENWMEDFGSGTLRNGAVTVSIDPTFAETTNTNTDYHILLTPRGDSKTLYVANLTAKSFEVHESGHGTSSIAFDYRIVAKRKGYEGQRLTDVTQTFHAENARYEAPSRRAAQGTKAIRQPIKVSVTSVRLPAAVGGER